MMTTGRDAWEALDGALENLGGIMGAAMSAPPTEMAVEAILIASGQMLVLADMMPGTDTATLGVQALAMNFGAMVRLLLLDPCGRRDGGHTQELTELAGIVMLTLQVMDLTTQREIATSKDDGT